MKIGIVTYHRTLNYGACLQAVATRVVLEKLGHDVYYVDYWPEYHKDKYSLFPKSKFQKLTISQKARFIINFIRHYSQKKKRIDNFNRFFQVYIYPYCRPIEDSYDVVIYGSDQIWRKQIETGQFDPFYFGKNKIKTKRHVSYAASMGLLPDKEQDKLIVKELLSYLDAISVRETKLKELVVELGYECELSLDPTLLLDREQWLSLMNTKPTTSERYVLYYKLISNSFDEDAMMRFAREHHLKLITLYGVAKKDTDDKITTASPQRMLSLINGAEYIFTSSYHGMIFSILLHKPFYAAFRMNSERAKSLLSDLNLADRLLEPNSLIPQGGYAIDFSKVDEIIKNKRKISIEYLEKIVK